MSYQIPSETMNAMNTPYYARQGERVLDAWLEQNIGSGLTVQDAIEVANAVRAQIESAFGAADGYNLSHRLCCVMRAMLSHRFRTRWYGLSEQEQEMLRAADLKPMNPEMPQEMKDRIRANVVKARRARKYRRNQTDSEREHVDAKLEAMANREAMRAWKQW